MEILLKEKKDDSNMLNVLADNNSKLELRIDGLLNVLKEQEINVVNLNHKSVLKNNTWADVASALSGSEIIDLDQAARSSQGNLMINLSLLQRTHYALMSSPHIKKHSRRV